MSFGSGHGAAAYTDQQVIGESPLARVARVYDLARNAVRRARNGLERDDARLKAAGIDRAALCLSLLQSSLDLEAGGEVAFNLDRMYTYMLRRLSEGHAKNDDAALAEVASHLDELGSAWREAASREETAPAQTAAPTLEPAAPAAVR